MADNIAITAGSGTTVSTEEVSTLNGAAATPQHVQRMLAAIRTADGTAIDLPGDVTNGLDVDVTRSVLPTGAATSAKQDTMIGHLDGVEGLLTTIDADTGNLGGILTAVQRLDDAISGSEMQVDVVGALPAGTNAIGKLAPNSGVDIGDVDVASIAAGSNLIGNVGISPRTSGGLTAFCNPDLDEADVTVKASAGQLYGWYIYNDAAAEVYVHFYDALIAGVTVGTTRPLFTLGIPAGGGANVFGPVGIAFAAGITVAATTAVSGTGAPAANQVVCSLFYA